jgi:hypothetical protein
MVCLHYSFHVSGTGDKANCGAEADIMKVTTPGSLETTLEQRSEAVFTGRTHIY